MTLITVKKVISFGAKLVQSKMVKLPPFLEHCPPNTVVKQGYKLFSLGEERNIIGFFIPRLGIFDPSGKMVLEIKGAADIKNHSPNPRKLKVKGRTLAAILEQSDMRLVFNQKTGNIDGILLTLDSRFLFD